jgi:hypothetical protein
VEPKPDGDATGQDPFDDRTARRPVEHGLEKAGPHGKEPRGVIEASIKR